MLHRKFPGQLAVWWMTMLDSFSAHRILTSVWDSSTGTRSSATHSHPFPPSPMQQASTRQGGCGGSVLKS